MWPIAEEPGPLPTTIWTVVGTSRLFWLIKMAPLDDTTAAKAAVLQGKPVGGPVGKMNGMDTEEARQSNWDLGDRGSALQKDKRSKYGREKLGRETRKNPMVPGLDLIRR